MTRVQRSVVTLLAIVLLLAAATGCQRKVEVETGERVLCSYGHTVTDTVETIEVPSADAGNYTVATRTIVCEKHREAERLYAEAQDAIDAGDLKAAEKSLAAVIELDSGFRKAGEQLAAIDAGDKPAPDRGSAAPGDQTEQPDDENPDDGGEITGPIASLTGWMPDTLSGYKADPIIADTMSLSREYVSAKREGKVLVVSAEQVLSAKEAESMVATVKRSYDQDGATLKIGGNAAYAGSDGRGVAVLGIADGPVFIALQLSGNSGSVADLVDELVTIAEGLPK